MKLALGPLLYYWPRDKVFSFYEQIASTPVDIVYLGETVCARRHELRLDDWLKIGETLKEAGKEVVLSTQVLLESGSHLQAVKRITENPFFTVEANDMGAVSFLSNKADFIAGPHLNVYNPETLKLMGEFGAIRWVIPLEMNRTDLALMQESRPPNLQTEVFAYGRMPLAFSARCFTARYYDLPKDDCHFRCNEYPDGLLLNTTEHEAFLILNGTQTQSSSVYNLLNAVPELKRMKVDVLRISPQSEHTAKIITFFDEVRQERLSPTEANKQIKDWMPAKACNGYWYGLPGMEWHTP